MTYAETQEYLFALRAIGSKFGLERMHALYEAAGKPGQGLPIIHVAGTNGKGSVCAMLEAMARANGCKTGLFTSPHLLRLGERVQVNRAILSEAQIVRYVAELRPLCEQLAAGDPQRHPTFFELMTVIALLHFEREGCEIIILETGLGGRLDSTNVVRPTVTVITSIGLDHQEILGDTLEQIAAEKAGIIKRGVPLVLGKLPPEAARVILDCAAREGAPVLNAEALFDPQSLAAAGIASVSGSAPASAVGSVTSASAADSVTPVASESVVASVSAALPVASESACTPESASASEALAGGRFLRPYPQTALAGEFQRRNAAVALLAYEQLCESLANNSAQQRGAGAQPVDGTAKVAKIFNDPQKSLAALRTVQWAGRWQTLGLTDGRELILDSSHNEEGARALEENLSRFVQTRGVRPVVITGALGQARADSLLHVIARYAAAIVLVEVSQPRACSLEQMRAAVPADFNGGVASATVEQLFAPVQQAGAWLRDYLQAHEGAPLLVTGSIYLIGEVLTRLQGDVSAEGIRLQDKISAG